MIDINVNNYINIHIIGVINGINQGFRKILNPNYVFILISGRPYDGA